MANSSFASMFRSQCTRRRRVGIKFKAAKYYFHLKKQFLYKLKNIQKEQQQHAIKYAEIWQNDEEFSKLDTFHRAIKPYIFIAQFFGVLPLVNALARNPSNVAFSIKTLTMLSTLSFFIFGGVRTLQIIGRMLDSGITPRNIITIVYLTTNTWLCILFLNLARHWPQLIQYWTRVDVIFLLPPYNRQQMFLKRQIGIVSLIFFVLALCEHVLYYSSNYYNYRMMILHCKPNNTEATFRDYLIHSQYRDIFNYVPYCLPIVIYAFLLNATFNFMWNFMDIFIMLVSLGLAARFYQFGTYIAQLKGRRVPDAMWYQLRQQHIMLCDFIAFVDEHLSFIVLTSSLFNMYFICNQLLNIFTKLRWPINYVYFWVSLLLLLTRTASVFMLASRIQDAAMLPLQALYYVSSSDWTEEVQRFVAQIRNEEIGLTGKRFYVLTRRSLFGLAATIITYEFMLLQFDVKSRKGGLPDICL